MAQAARRIEAQPLVRRSHLRAVARPVRTPSARKPARASARASEARCRAAFNAVTMVMLVLAAVGLVRVAVLARAAEMTISEGRVSKQIKSQRIETDRLEIEGSSLATPSRIEQIAGATMQMGRPTSVRYITLPGAPDAAQSAKASSAGSPVAVDPDGSGARRIATVLSALADMSVGEAQSLLVGDVGLAGSR
ncbi:MAG: cell division protein FtsL [Coriobacteriia bacterium]|nr:cell division protein FtsL [Coriobacteriia bacterium]